MPKIPGEKWLRRAMLVGTLAGTAPEIGCAHSDVKPAMRLKLDVDTSPVYPGVKVTLNTTDHLDNPYELSWVSNNRDGEFFLGHDSKFADDDIEDEHVSAREAVYLYGAQIEKQDESDVDFLLEKYGDKIRGLTGSKEDHRTPLIDALKIALRDTYVAAALTEYWQKGGYIVGVGPGGSNYGPKSISIAFDKDIMKMVEVINHELLHGVMENRKVYDKRSAGGIDHSIIVPLQQRFTLIHDVARGTFNPRNDVHYEDKGIIEKEREYGTSRSFGQFVEKLDENESSAQEFVESGEFYEAVLAWDIRSIVWSNNLHRFFREVRKKYDDGLIVAVEEGLNFDDVQPDVMVYDESRPFISIQYRDFTTLDDEAIERVLTNIPEEHRRDIREAMEKMRDDKNFARKDPDYTTSEVQDIVHVHQVNALLFDAALRLGFFHAQKSNASFEDVLADSPEYRFDFSRFKALFLAYLHKEHNPPPKALAESLLRQITGME